MEYRNGYKDPAQNGTGSIDRKRLKIKYIRIVIERKRKRETEKINIGSRHLRYEKKPKCAEKE